MIGVIGKKEGMTQVFMEDGTLVPVTIVSVESNAVVDLRTQGKDGYEALVVGSGKKKESRLTAAELGQMKKAGLETPVGNLQEIRDCALELKAGDNFGVEVLENCNFVDVVATSKGKGFQGVMKRHNFAGGPKTHGSKFHRAAGGTGMATTPGRTIKGKKMAGRMGGERVTVQNLELVKIDSVNQLLVIKGALPGPKGCPVFVRKAKKR